MTFENLNIYEKIDDPEERQAGAVSRVDRKELKPIKKKSSSVSVNQYQSTMKIVGIIFVISLVLVIAFLGWKGISLFLQN